MDQIDAFWDAITALRAKYPATDGHGQALARLDGMFEEYHAVRKEGLGVRQVLPIVVRAKAMLGFGPFCRVEPGELFNKMRGRFPGDVPENEAYALCVLGAKALSAFAPGRL